MTSTSNCPPSALLEAQSFAFRDALPKNAVSSASVPDVSSRIQNGILESPQLSKTDNRKADEKQRKRSFLGKVGGILHKPFQRSPSASAAPGAESCADTVTPNKESLHSLSASRPRPDAITRRTSPPIVTPIRCHTVPPQYQHATVKETDRIFLEYDPVLKRKVLNSYEILEEIGRGEHGRVKLAVDLRTNELVAIKIVNRSSRKDRRLRMRRSSSAKSMLAKQHNNSQLKKKIEIAIMKKCHHKHIVELKEVLDDKTSNKIYLVLEYLEKGEIKWKKRGLPAKNLNSDSDPDCIPCIGSVSRTLDEIEDEEELLLSDEYQPNLNFKQCRKIFRDVLLGLEYLHLQGIVHRDVKPANLLVSSDDNVKISDFGVSFASSLSKSDLGCPVDEWDLAKTAGTPAFFAPELCQTNHSSTDGSDVAANDGHAPAPDINYKIDIWALGVTLYCLLFGKVPFNAESEYELFKVIVNDEVSFPESASSFNSPGPITDEEFELAKDLLKKMLDKSPTRRIEIADIKVHPFTMMDLDTNLAELHEFVFLNSTCQPGLLDFSMNWNEKGEMVTKEEIDNAVIGVGSRIKHGLARAITANGGSESDVRTKFSALQMEQINSMSSEDSSILASPQSPSKFPIPQNHSLILSDAIRSSTPSSISSSRAKYTREAFPITRTDDGLASPRPALHSEHGLHCTSVEYDSPFSPEFSLSRVSSPGRRRGTSLLTEAPQIETKRNVSGDVYLKNQNIVDTFKDLQQQDNRRRRSSNFKSATPSRHNSKHSFSSSAVPLAVHLCHNEQLSPTHPHSTWTSPPGAMDESTIIAQSHEARPSKYQSTIKVGPININNRRPSSVMSLPLSESYALLDSFNDEILRVKFEKFTQERQQHLQSMNLSPAPQSPTPATKNPSAAEPAGLTKRLHEFSLTEAMSDESSKQDNSKDSPVPVDATKRGSNGVAPNVVPPRAPFYRGTSFAHLRSASVSSSNTDSESDEEAGNLTLAFSSKLALPGRPNFMDMSSRSVSYDSSLPQLLRPGQRINQPLVFSDVIPEVEDLPSALIPNIPRPSVSAAPELTLTNSVTSEQDSITTIKFPNGPRGGSKPPPDGPSHKSIRGSINANADNIVRQMESASREWLHAPTSNNAFNNHYKKEPIYSAFPNALHMDNNQEQLINTRKQKHAQIRPSCHRSQSVTIALLGPKRDDWNDDKD